MDRAEARADRALAQFDIHLHQAEALVRELERSRIAARAESKRRIAELERWSRRMR